MNLAKVLINEIRVKFTTNLLRGEAFRWFKHIIKDYLINSPENQDSDMVNIYLFWVNYETALHCIFGELDEKRMVEQKLQILT